MPRAQVPSDFQDVVARAEFPKVHTSCCACQDEQTCSAKAHARIGSGSCLLIARQQRLSQSVARGRLGRLSSIIKPQGQCRHEDGLQGRVR